jgi:hypothetical protein
MQQGGNQCNCFGNPHLEPTLWFGMNCRLSTEGWQPLAPCP